MTDRPSIGVQLYTVRDELERDFVGTVRELADIGFTGVETAFFDLTDPMISEAATIFADHGLTVIAAHCELPRGEAGRTVLQHAQMLGTDRVILPGWPEDIRYRTSEGTRELLQEYAEAISYADEHGVRVGFHNHWWELAHADHGVPLIIMADELPPSAFLELDFYWSAQAGWRTPHLVEQLAGRVELVHVKDGPLTTPEAPNTALGRGVMPLAESLAATSTADWWVVELDECETPMLGALRDSFAWLTDNDHVPARPAPTPSHETF